MENPSAQTRCPVLDGVGYCYYTNGPKL
jgi:hypothetical protein